MVKASITAGWQCPCACCNRRISYPVCKEWGYRYSPACHRINLAGGKTSAKALRWPRCASQSPALPTSARGQRALRRLTIVREVCTIGVARGPHLAMPAGAPLGGRLLGEVLGHAGDTAMVISTLGIRSQVQQNAMSGDDDTAPPANPAAMDAAATADYHLQLHGLPPLIPASGSTGAAVLAPSTCNNAFWSDSGNSSCGATSNGATPSTGSNRCASSTDAAKYANVNSTHLSESGRWGESPSGVGALCETFTEDDSGDGVNRAHSRGAGWDGGYDSGSCGGDGGCSGISSSCDADRERRSARGRTERCVNQGDGLVQRTAGAEWRGGLPDADGGFVGFRDGGCGSGHGNGYGVRDENASGCEWRHMDSFSRGNESHFVFGQGNGGDGSAGLGSGSCGGGDGGSSGGGGGDGGSGGGGQGFGAGEGSDSYGFPRAVVIWDVFLSLTVASVASVAATVAAVAAALLPRQANLMLQRSRQGSDPPRYSLMLSLGPLLWHSLHLPVHPLQHKRLVHEYTEKQELHHDQGQECSQHAQEPHEKQPQEQLMKQRPFAFQLSGATVHLQDEGCAAGDSPLLTGATAAAAAAAVAAHMMEEGLRTFLHSGAGFANKYVHRHNLGSERVGKETAAGPWFAFSSQQQDDPSSWCFPAAPPRSHTQIEHNMAPVGRPIQQQDSSGAPPGGPYYGFLQMDNADSSIESQQQQPVSVPVPSKSENHQQWWAQSEEALLHSMVFRGCNSGNGHTYCTPKKVLCRGVGPLNPSLGGAWMPGQREPSHEATSAAPRQQKQQSRRHLVSLSQLAIKRRGLWSPTYRMGGAAFSKTACDRAARRGNLAIQSCLGPPPVLSWSLPTSAAMSMSVLGDMAAAPAPTRSARAAVATAAVAVRSSAPNTAAESRGRGPAPTCLSKPHSVKGAVGRPASVSLHDEIATLRAVEMGLEAAERRAEQWLAAATGKTPAEVGSSTPG